jgi:hypothetical protein
MVCIFLSRYSNSDEKILATSLKFEIVHQLLLMKRHTPPPIILPKSAIWSMHKKTARCMSMSLFTHDSEKHRICFSGPIDRIVLNRTHPVCSKVIVRSPIEQSVKGVYLLALVFSSGCRLACTLLPPLPLSSPGVKASSRVSKPSRPANVGPNRSYQWLL